jgi:hypothetical protein
VTAKTFEAVPESVLLGHTWGINVKAANGARILIIGGLAQDQAEAAADALEGILTTVRQVARQPLFHLAKRSEDLPDGDWYVYTRESSHAHVVARNLNAAAARWLIGRLEAEIAAAEAATAEGREPHAGDPNITAVGP